jgi:glyoxylase I family protein
MISSAFIDHLVFRVSSLQSTERFYTAILNQQPQRAEGSLMYLAGDTRLFFTPSAGSPTGKYDKENIGLNHVAFGVRSRFELETIQERLDNIGIVHSRIKLDQYGLKEFIWLDDPDGLRLEFYVRPR